MTRMRVILLIFLAIGTLLFVLAMSFNFWEVRKALPPHELLDTRVEPETVMPDADGMLNVTIYTGSIRRQNCYVQIFRTFANADTKEIVYQTLMIGGGVPRTGKLTEFPFKMELPAARFPPGNYSYTAYAMNKCGEDKIFVVPAVMSYFKVARPP